MSWDSDIYLRQTDKILQLTKFLIELNESVDRHNTQNLYDAPIFRSNDLKDWWMVQKKELEKRRLAAAERARQEQVRKDIFQRLTPEEREALYGWKENL